MEESQTLRSAGLRTRLPAAEAATTKVTHTTQATSLQRQLPSRRFSAGPAGHAAPTQLPFDTVAVGKCLVEVLARLGHQDRLKRWKAIIDKQYVRTYCLFMPRPSLKETILDAGLRSMFRTGYNGTTVRQIVAGASAPRDRSPIISGQRSCSPARSWIAISCTSKAWWRRRSKTIHSPHASDSDAISTSSPEGSRTTGGPGAV